MTDGDYQETFSRRLNSVDLSSNCSDQCDNNVAHLPTIPTQDNGNQCLAIIILLNSVAKQPKKFIERNFLISYKSTFKVIKLFGKLFLIFNFKYIYLSSLIKLKLLKIKTFNICISTGSTLCR